MAFRPRPLDLVELRALCLSVELGSFGRAAAAMSISQPALSKRIRELELFAGTQLFVRTPRGARATAAGEALYREARALLSHAEIVEDTLDGLRGRRAPVRLAASHTIAETVLPAALARVRDDAPDGLAVELVAANSEVVRDLVRERRADLGLAGDALSPDLTVGLAAGRLCDDEVVVAVSADHPWAGRTRIELAEFLATPMVMRDPSSNARRLLEATLDARGLSAAPPLTEVGSTAAAVAAAVSGPAPAVLSRRAVGAASLLTPVAVEDLTLHRRFVILTRAGESPAPATARLIAHLRASIS